MATIFRLSDDTALKTDMILIKTIVCKCSIHMAAETALPNKRKPYIKQSHTVVFLCWLKMVWDGVINCSVVKFFLEIMEVSSRLKNKRTSWYKDRVQKATLGTCSLLKVSLMLNDFRKTCQAEDVFFSGKVSILQHQNNNQSHYTCIATAWLSRKWVPHWPACSPNVSLKIFAVLGNVNLTKEDPNCWPSKILLQAIIWKHFISKITAGLLSSQTINRWHNILATMTLSQLFEICC